MQQYFYLQLYLYFYYCRNFLSLSNEKEIKETMDPCLSITMGHADIKHLSQRKYVLLRGSFQGKVVARVLIYVLNWHSPGDTGVKPVKLQSLWLVAGSSPAVSHID